MRCFANSTTIVPMAHAFAEKADEDEEIEVEMLPVEELLDRVMLKRVREKGSVGKKGRLTCCLFVFLFLIYKYYF